MAIHEILLASIVFMVGGMMNSTPDTSLEGLDQPLVGTAARQCNILVSGVHVSGPDCWIQLADAADESRQLVLHLPADANVEDALRALAAAVEATLRPEPALHVRERATLNAFSPACGDRFLSRSEDADGPAYRASLAAFDRNPVKH